MYRGHKITIDRANKRYKRFHNLLFIPVSDGWKPLPEVRHVVMTRVSMKQRLRGGAPGVASSTVKISRFAVFLVGRTKSLRVEVCIEKNLNRAQRTARELSEYFGVDLQDYT